MEATYQDRVLHCRNCGTSFVWTAGEQAFYTAKHLLNEPGRCPACRTAARDARQSAGIPSPRHREFFPVVCDRCGVQTKVPFLPRDDRPVYCSSCYDAVRAERLSYGRT